MTACVHGALMNPFLTIMLPSIRGLRNNTPEARQEIYARARAVLEDRARLLGSLPSQQLMDAQKAKLDTATAEIERQFGAAEKG